MVVRRQGGGQVSSTHRRAVWEALYSGRVEEMAAELATIFRGSIGLGAHCEVSASGGANR